MFEVGAKYVCGGRIFWCIDIDGYDRADMCCMGTHLIVTPANGGMFKKVGEIETDSPYTARLSFGELRRGVSYTVKEFNGRQVRLNNGVQLSLESFASIF